MCTVSWFHTQDGYELFCNRDEKKTRSLAATPMVRVRNGVRYVAPQDGDFGGTWIASNEHGLTLALLNGIVRGVQRQWRSRGHLVLEWIERPGIDDLLSATRRADLTGFAPFTMVALQPHVPACVVDWDGRDLTTSRNAENRMPLLSSSFDFEGVRAARMREFQQLLRQAAAVDGEMLLAFHGSHQSGPSAYSTCMHRPDAETVSFTRITVNAEEARILYSPMAPCQSAAGETVRLERAPALVTS